MGLLNSLLGIIGKGVAKGVSDVVEKAVTEAVKPAATKFAQKQADLITSATKSMEDASQALQQAGTEAEKAAAQNPEQVKMAMEYLRRNAQQAAAEIEKLEDEKPLTDEEVMAQWETLLPDYPKWQCGGNHFELEKDDLGDGETCIRFYLSAVEAYYIAYQAVLIANGFRPKFRGETDTWYKEVDGRYPAVHLFHVDDNECQMQLVYYNETREAIVSAANV